MSTPYTPRFSQDPTTRTTDTAAPNAQPAKAEQPSMTTSKIVDAAHRAVDSVAERVAGAEAALRDQAADKEQTLREAADTATAKANEMRNKTQTFITENPLTAAGIAFTAGILFSAWMRR